MWPANPTGSELSNTREFSLTKYQPMESSVTKMFGNKSRLPSPVVCTSGFIIAWTTCVDTLETLFEMAETGGMT
jgi:hypothetical protein